MRSDTFNFEIPPRRIAQTPAARRDESKLMVVRRSTGAIEHRVFRDLPGLLNPGDLLVANNTRVNPCRLYATRKSGGRVEVFVLARFKMQDSGFKRNNVGSLESRILNLESGTLYTALTHAGGKLEPGEVLSLEGGTVTLLERDHGGPGHWLVRIESPDNVDDLLARAGKMPLPQYIERARGPDARDELDRERYQTVFAQAPGAVAAPTAGLHFTPAVFDALAARGVDRAFVTLHVGPGTFRPLKAETLAGHDMHAEPYTVPPEVEAAVRNARTSGGRVIAVGTTTCRTLETVSDESGLPRAGDGETRLFIHPPWRFRCVDALITNFHLPRSTLIFLVAAYLGVELTRRAYTEALAGDYRFFSYGDAMLCLP
ncbi:MAG: tRNA preQ1(34) S-adenosylmethionine ribosyltransferase-isomerase QueA [Planctomycetes bacterium]|jgi:S-adenosylmethionine:tRNA ribosyltransferase-isomerase|nr:tRNA preQ1(34) S-adenosylmethionine ribosyltransferase-isomerase QueA [Planctomycetota bacterium]MCL4730153.1 tRNA preQ1(34) S-adenosylmethionine ribosyltransferase-isomerase QueA [Planctomycetota bacterium]